MVLARITSKGQVTIPKAVREMLGVVPGDALDFHVGEAGVSIRPVHRRRLSEFRGIFRVKEPAHTRSMERERAWESMTKRLRAPTDWPHG